MKKILKKIKKWWKKGADTDIEKRMSEKSRDLFLLFLMR